MEKQKRKVEGDLRLAQESLDQLDRERKEAEVTLCRKNKEIAALAQKLEREQSNVIKCEKQIKECGVGHFARKYFKVSNVGGSDDLEENCQFSVASFQIFLSVSTQHCFSRNKI